jgi:hypothetical protein
MGHNHNERREHIICPLFVNIFVFGSVSNTIGDNPISQTRHDFLLGQKRSNPPATARHLHNQFFGGQLDGRGAAALLAVQHGFVEHCGIWSDG